MSSPPPMTPMRRAWIRWKTLRLPWRKRFLVGLDLQGNTFWEFRDTLSPGRWRRIVEYPRSTHYSDIKISPQWHQWLRHTRTDPPSLTEQSQDLVRQRNLKILAAEADRRWAAKASVLDMPKDRPELKQPDPAIGVKDRGGYQRTEGERGVRNAVGGGLGDEVQGTGRKMGDVLEQEKAQQRLEAEGARDARRVKEPKQYKEDPWKKARGGPSENWQPEAWSPGSAAPRR